MNLKNIIINNIDSTIDDTIFINLLYSNLLLIENSKDFENWKIQFSITHGHLNTQRKIDIFSLNEIYKIDIQDKDEILKLIFCFETYYTIILRIIAFNSVFKSKNIELIIFDNAYFERKGITNYNCPEYYNWFLKINNLFSNIYNLNEFVKHKYLNNTEIDFIKNIFENIIPSSVRHSMGEFFTPDWLANYVLEKLTEGDESPYNKKYLDPSCGSGTFIFNILKKYKSKSNNEIFNNVYGFDINPVSVLAAKTNYLLLYCNEFDCHENNKLKIPIYYVDAICSPFISNFLFLDNNNYDLIDIPLADYIIGNPPWVNWEYLPKDYKHKTIDLWKHYELFNTKGLEKGFIKEDISVLLTYVAIDKYLKPNGKLGFIIKETLFKSIKHGEGFRKFRLEPNGIDLRVFRVDDLTNFKPFNGAVNRTAIVFIEKSKKTIYPVDYVCWYPKNGKRSFHNDSNYKLLEEYFSFEIKHAKPCNSNASSGWITVNPESMEKTNEILGKSHYKARTGLFTGGANGIFWLRFLKENNNYITVENIFEKAKNKMKHVVKDIEKDFIFPFLTGNELKFWHYEYTKYILCPHTIDSRMYPIESNILEKYPLTKQYLYAFKDELENRKGFTSFDKNIHLKYFYALQRIGEYSFAEYKVAWRYISKHFTPAVIEYANDDYLGRKNIMPNEKIIFVGLNDRDEAYYLCGLLSSDIYRNTIENYMVGTQITPSIINNLSLPLFEKTNENHIKISQLCQQGHKDFNNTNIYLTKINKIVNEICSDFNLNV